MIYVVHRVPVGGTEGKPDPADTAAEEKSKNDPQPVFFNAPNQEATDELAHCCELSAVIDCTPQQGTWAMTCAKRRAPYVAITFGPEHSQGFTSFVKAGLLEAMCDEQETELFDAAVAKIVTGDASPTTKKAKASPKPAAKTAGTAKAAGTKTADATPTKGSAEQTSSAKALLMAKIAELSEGKRSTDGPADAAAGGKPAAPPARAKDKKSDSASEDSVEEEDH